MAHHGTHKRSPSRVAEASRSELAPEIVLLDLPTIERDVHLRAQDYLLELHARVRAGLPVRAFDHFQQYVGLATNALAKLVQITLRTLSRRREEGRFHPDESDRLFRTARLFGQVLTLFDLDRDSARRWFSEPHRALGGQAPMDLATTDAGVRQVEALIGRLEHGIAP